MEQTSVEAEGKQRPGRLDADARPVAVALAGLLGLTALSAMMLSFQAHTDVAAERLGAGRLAFAYPLAVDGALVGLAVAMLVQARRGEDRKLAAFFLLFFTLLSSTVNVVHVLDITPPGTQYPLVGVVLGGLLPVMVLGLTEVLARVVFSPAATGPATPAQVEPAAPAPVVQDEPADTDRPDPVPVTQAEPTPAIHAAPEAADAPTEPLMPARPAPAIQAVPDPQPERPVQKPKPRPARPTSGVPEDRIAEVHGRIDALLAEGSLSRQEIADQLTAELDMPITKSRVARRADALKEAA